MPVSVAFRKSVQTILSYVAFVAMLTCENKNKNTPVQYAVNASLHERKKHQVTPHKCRVKLSSISPFACLLGPQPPDRHLQSFDASEHQVCWGILASSFSCHRVPA